MSVLMDTVLYKQKIWVGQDGKEFLVDNITVHDGDLWIEYHNSSTKQEYNCRLEAFANRFTMKERPQ